MRECKCIDFINIFSLFFKQGLLFFSVTSPHRKPCVCHTHTEKQALYNSSVKSPCSELGWGVGGGWLGSSQEGEILGDVR